MMKSSALLLAAVLLPGLCAAAFADDDVELRINGHFRPASDGTAAPGWIADTVSSDSGAKTRIVSGDESDEFAMEITGSATVGMSVYTDYFPVSGRTLKFEAEVSGNGTAWMGVLAFDAQKNLLTADSRIQAFLPAASPSDVKFSFPIDPARVKFIRLRIGADKNSRVTFGDIEAEFKHLVVPAAVPAPVIVYQMVPPPPVPHHGPPPVIHPVVPPRPGPPPPAPHHGHGGHPRR